MVQKLLTDKPETAVAIMKHVWDQEYKHLAKKVLMNKYGEDMPLWQNLC